MQKTKNNELPVLAIDLGGTKIAAALISPDNRLIDRAHSPTLAAEGPKPVTSRIFSTIDRLLSQSATEPAQLYGIAIAAASAIDTNKGLVTSSPNLPGWINIPLRDMARKRYGVDSCLLNDASAAAMAEHRLGAGRGTTNLIYLTVSTGIGGGIIVNGELYSGISGGAGELGHMTIDANGPECDCGNAGNPGEPEQTFVLQSFSFLFFVRDFHAAIFVSPLMSTAEAVSNAVANFRPLAVSV